MHAAGLLAAQEPAMPGQPGKLWEEEPGTRTALGRRGSEWGSGEAPFSRGSVSTTKTTAEKKKKTLPLAFVRAWPPSAGLSARHMPRSASGSLRAPFAADSAYATL